MTSKLALGTAQFGMDYGINNSSGKPGLEEIGKILDLARKSGINTIDTAQAYGDSESTLGHLGVNDMKVVSKLPSCKIDEVEKVFSTSLKSLKIQKLYGYLIHNFSIYKNEKGIWDKLKKIKKQGLVDKIGLSLYNTEELDELINDNLEIDILQVPYNIFDQRFSRYFESLKSRGVEIHTRSVFLQGLFFMNPLELPVRLESAYLPLLNLKSMAKKKALSIEEICLGYTVGNPNIDHVIVGVDNDSQLKCNIRSSSSFRLQNISIDWNSMKVADSTIINPSLWTA